MKKNRLKTKGKLFLSILLASSIFYTSPNIVHATAVGEKDIDTFLNENTEQSYKYEYLVTDNNLNIILTYQDVSTEISIISPAGAVYKDDTMDLSVDHGTGYGSFVWTTFSSATAENGKWIIYSSNEIDNLYPINNDILSDGIQINPDFENGTCSVVFTPISNSGSSYTCDYEIHAVNELNESIIVGDGIITPGETVSCPIDITQMQDGLYTLNIYLYALENTLPNDVCVYHKLTVNGFNLEKSLYNINDKTPSQADSTEWVIENDEYYKCLTFDVGAGTSRYSVFYTADSNPSVSISSPSGTIYKCGEKYNENTDGINVITRVKNTVSNYKNIQYDVIYITGITEPQTWKMTISGTEAIKEFFIVKTKVPNNWESIVQEYKTNPQDLMLWYIAKDSKYYASDIKQIAKKDDKIPAVNNIKTTEEDEAPPKDYTNLIKFCVVVAVIITVVLVIKKLRKRKKAAIDTRQKKIDEENQKIKEKKEKENSKLSNILDEFDDQYIDDDDNTPKRKTSEIITDNENKEQKPKNSFSFSDDYDDEDYSDDDYFISESKTPKITNNEISDIDTEDKEYLDEDDDIEEYKRETFHNQIASPPEEHSECEAIIESEGTRLSQLTLLKKETFINPQTGNLPSWMR